MSQLCVLRERAGMLQDDVARRLGIDRSTVAKWETGVAFPRTDKLPAIARLYNCTIDDLFGQEPTNKPA